MRYCLRRSFKLQEIIEACKSALVDVAEEEIKALGEKQTVNRVSIMTGIHRADVARLAGDTDCTPKRLSGNIINRLIAKWQTDARFLTASGKPRQLSFDGKTGDFAELVYSVSTDPNPYTLLLELERIHAVERTGKGLLKLKTQEYIVRSDAKRALEHLAQDNDDLIYAVEQNLQEQHSEPNLHLRTEYDKISQAFLPEIRKWLLSEGSMFHAKLRNYLSRFDEDTNAELEKSNKHVRVSLCSFSRTVELNSSGESNNLVELNESGEDDSVA